MRRRRSHKFGGRSRSGRGWLLRWHRRVGVALALLILMLVLTGIALNHADGLGLRHRPVEADWVYRWYGMEPTGEPVAYRAGEVVIGGWDGIVNLGDGGRVLENFGPLAGAVAAGPLYLVASPTEIAVFTAEGALVERMAAAAVARGRIEAVGHTDGGARLLLRTDMGIYSSDTELAQWRSEPEPVSAEWSQPEADLPAVLVERLTRAWRGPGVTLDRIALDLHTGRFFGKVGVWLVDVAGLGLVLLVATGALSAFRRARRDEGVRK